MNTHQLFGKFHRQLDALSHWQLTAITAAVTERAWPNYALFCELAEFESANELRHSLNLVWDFTAGLQSAKNFERLLERLEDGTPAAEEYDMFGVQLALDFTASLHCTINCAMKSSVDEVASSLTLSLSTIGKFIKATEAEELHGTELSQYIENHELYEVQQLFIDELLRMVKAQKKASKQFTKELRAFAANEGVSQLGIDSN